MLIMVSCRATDLVYVQYFCIHAWEFKAVFLFSYIKTKQVFQHNQFNNVSMCRKANRCISSGILSAPTSMGCHPRGENGFWMDLVVLFFYQAASPQGDVGKCIWLARHGDRLICRSDRPCLTRVGDSGDQLTCPSLATQNSVVCRLHTNGQRRYLPYECGRCCDQAVSTAVHLPLIINTKTFQE